ncbi:MAG: hypothetical protein R8K21_06280 [Mariprofundales bacterium]
MLESAQDIENKGKDNLSGYGLLNIRKALLAKKVAGNYQQDFMPSQVDGYSLTPVQMQVIFDFAEGDTTEWLDLNGDFILNHSALYSIGSSPIISLLDNKNQVSIAVAEFGLSFWFSVKQVRFHIYSGQII